MSDNENTETTETAATGSIIDPKYAEKMKNKPKDWLGTFLDERITKATTKTKKVKEPELNEDGSAVLDGDGEPIVNEVEKEVELAKRTLDLDALFAVCKANNIDTASMEEQRDRKNAPGRIRMTLGNRLRAASKHRHGLFDADGEWHDAPSDYLADAEKTQERDGTKIAKPKPEPESTDETSGEEEAA